MPQQMATCTVKQVSNNTISKTLGEARALMWYQKEIQIHVLHPPEIDYRDLHVMRINCQVYIQLD